MGLPEFLPAVETAGRLARKLRDADLMADAAIASIWPGTFFMTAARSSRDLVELSEDALALIGPSIHGASASCRPSPRTSTSIPIVTGAWH